MEREETNRAEETNRVFVFRKLSSGGHDEYEKGSTEEIQAEFTALLAGGYALFVDEVQVRSLEEAVGYWDTLFPTIKERTYVTAVPAIRGGANDRNTAVDPVCGVEVALTPSTDFSSYEGKTYYFCSSDCRMEFEGSEEEYVGDETP